MKSDSIIGSENFRKPVIWQRKKYHLAEKMALKLILNCVTHKKSRRKKQVQLYSQDPYVHALQVKFGYAITCHKAQGGEWHVISTSTISTDWIGANFTAGPIYRYYSLSAPALCRQCPVLHKKSSAPSREEEL